MYAPIVNDQFAWACGLFEGEGYFDTNGRGRRLCLTTTDHDVLLKFQRIVGCGSIIERNRQKDHWKQQYMWREGRRAYVTPLLEQMLPYLGERRQQQARIVLDKEALREWPDPQVEECGFTTPNSTNGVYRHRTKKEESCRACLDAAAEYQRNHRVKKAARIAEENQI